MSILLTAALLTANLSVGDCIRLTDKEIGTFPPDTEFGKKVRNWGWKVTFASEGWLTFKVIDLRDGHSIQSEPLRFRIDEVTSLDWATRTECKLGVNK